jgi:DNA-binding transcriptional LysR family regulator
MAAAAQSIGLSQPSLTNHLKLFEGYFDQDVFVIEGRKKLLTPFGRELRELFKGRFDNLDFELKALTESFQKSEDVQLRIAGRAEVLGFIAGKVNFPGTLVFIPTDGASAVQGLLERKFNLAISNHISKAEKFHGKKLFSNGFSVIAQKGLIAKDAQLSKSLIAGLVDVPYLSYKEDDENLSQVLRHYKIDRSPRIRVVLSEWSRLVEMVEAGRGWTIGPDRHASDESQVRAVPIPRLLIPETQFYSIYRKESLDLIWFKDFLKELSQNMS